MKVSKKFRVLYSNDNKDDCFMLSVLLGFSDIEVVAANTTVEALGRAQNENFGFYLLDVRFAQGDGLSLCRELRESTPHIPIFLTHMNEIIKKSWRQKLIPA